MRRKRLFLRYLDILQLSKLWRSPYFLSALLIHISLFKIWLGEQWWDLPLATLPALLGFTLGGLAVFLSFTEKNFQKFLIEKEEGELSSPFIDVVTTYTHFLVMMAAALTLNLISNGIVPLLIAILEEPPSSLPGLPSITAGCIFLLGFFSHFIFIYSVILLFSAIFALYRVATWYEDYHDLQ